MKITRLSLWRVALTSHITYRQMGGKVCDTVPTMVLRVDTDTPHSGWGEFCPIPHYLPAFDKGAETAMDEMAPLLLGAELTGPESIIAALDKHLLGHPYAKSLVDIALWDLMGKALDVPLYRLLGGLHAAELPLYHSVTCTDPHEMARMAKDAVDAGIQQIQIKLGADEDWQADVARFRLVREAIGPGLLLYGDWNTGATRLEASRTARAVRDLDVMIEQPCATLEDCKAVRDASNLPMKIDELAHDTASLLQAFNMGIMDAVALKLSKFGGIGKQRAARDLCTHLGARICMEDTWGSDIATAAALHLAAATPPRSLLNVADLSGYVGPRLDEKGPTRRAGKLAVPHGPGLGIEVNQDLLGQPLLTWG